jgi:hypothetical protein
MPADIYEFMSSFNKDLARPNRFEVRINPSQSLNSIPGYTFPNNLRLRCESAELPSRTFATAEQKFGSNPIEKYPYQTAYNDLVLTFIVSGDMYEKKFFDGWMSLINPEKSYNFNYKNTYVIDLSVVQYDVSNNPQYAVNIIESYPIAVNQLDLDWSSDGYHKLTVVFAYTYWTQETNLSLFN